MDGGCVSGYVYMERACWVRVMLSSRLCVSLKVGCMCTSENPIHLDHCSVIIKSNSISHPPHNDTMLLHAGIVAIYVREIIREMIK